MQPNIFVKSCLLAAACRGALAFNAGPRNEDGKIAVEAAAEPEQGADTAGEPGVYHIKSVRGICLEGLGHKARKGGRLKMWECDRSKRTQQWTYTNSTGQIRNMQGLCLHAAGPNTIGGQVRLRKCNTSQLSQQWSYDTDTRQIKNSHGICLNTTHGQKPASATPRMWRCDSPDVDRQWNLIAVSPTDAAGDGTSMPAFPYIKFIPLQVRGKPTSAHGPLNTRWRFGWVQISDIILKDVHGRVYRNLPIIPVQAINEYGNTRANETASNLIDGNSYTKWLDFNRQPVTLHFYEPVHVKHIAFVTGNDCDWRDPVQWIVKGSYNGYHWLDLANTMGEDANIPTQRRKQSPWFLLSMPPVVSAAGVVNSEEHPFWPDEDDYDPYGEYDGGDDDYDDDDHDDHDHSDDGTHNQGAQDLLGSTDDPTRQDSISSHSAHYNGTPSHAAQQLLNRADDLAMRSKNSSRGAHSNITHSHGAQDSLSRTDNLTMMRKNSSHGAPHEDGQTLTAHRRALDGDHDSRRDNHEPLL